MEDDLLSLVYELRERRAIAAKLRQWHTNLNKIEETTDTSSRHSVTSPRHSVTSSSNLSSKSAVYSKTRGSSGVSSPLHHQTLSSRSYSTIPVPLNNNNNLKSKSYSTLPGKRRRRRPLPQPSQDRSDRPGNTTSQDRPRHNNITLAKNATPGAKPAYLSSIAEVSRPQVVGTPLSVAINSISSSSQMVGNS